MSKQEITHTLLAVFAHPDDESFGPGGMLAKYAAQGYNVHVIIATDGNAGSVEAGSIEDEEVRQHGTTLAQVRSKELSDAAVALGITTIWSLPYRDSGMRGAPENQNPRALIQQPIEQLVAEVAEYMQRLGPQVVVTHDPFGGYGHPDHIRCCEAVSAAFYKMRSHGPSSTPTTVPNQSTTQSSTHPPQKLYYTAFDKRLLKLVVRLMPLFGQDPSAIGRNKDINLVEISQWDTPVHTTIDVSDYLEAKNLASRAHASQYSGGPAFVRILPAFLRRRFLANESFTRAFPAPERRNGMRAVQETDLFAGVH
ncbi:MAG: PIG-L family deacetylase [Chloroflexota bacterium]